VRIKLSISLSFRRDPPDSETHPLVVEYPPSILAFDMDPGPGIAASVEPAPVPLVMIEDEDECRGTNPTSVYL
jgi:hypothetical protein